MTRTLAGLAVVFAWLALDAGDVRAQFGYAGTRGGVGFTFGGKNLRVTGVVGGWSGYAVPGYGYPVVPGYAVPGYSWGAPYWVAAPGWWQAPVIVAPPPPTVFVLQQPVVVRQPVVVPLEAFDPPPREDPRAAARVDAKVRAGELMAIRPKANAVRPAAAVEPVPPPVPRRPEPVVPNEPKARAAFEVARAREAFEVGEYGRAAERLADAIAADPAAPLPYFLLAQARTARGEYAEAVAAVRDGMRRAPDWPASGFNLKAVYGPTAAAFDRHLAELREAADADPDDPAVGFLLGYHQWFLGDKIEAVKRFRKATRQARDNGIIERFLVEADGKS